MAFRHVPFPRILQYTAWDFSSLWLVLDLRIFYYLIHRIPFSHVNIFLATSSQKAVTFPHPGYPTFWPLLCTPGHGAGQGSSSHRNESITYMETLGSTLGLQGLLNDVV